MDHMVTAMEMNWDLVGVVGVYALAVVWLVHLWIAHRRRGDRRRPTDGMRIADGIVGLLISAMLVVFVILLALARVEGRSPYYHSRF